MSLARRTLLGLILAAPAALAAPEKSFAELLPADTLAFFEMAPLTAAEQERAVAFKALQEPELRRVLDRMLSEQGNFSKVAVPMGRSTLRARLDVRDSGLGFEIQLEDGKRSDKLRVRGHLAVAWVGLARRPRGNDVVPDLVVALGVENDLAEARRLVEAGLGMIDEGGRDLPRGKRDGTVLEWTHRDHRCSSVRLGDTPIHIGEVGRRLVITTLRKRLVDVIDRAATGASDSLAASRLHQETLRRATGSGTITTLLEVNVRALYSAFNGLGTPEAARIVSMAKLVGLEGLEGFTSVTRADAGGVAGTTSVLLSGRRVGIARLFEKAPPAKLGCLEFAPKDTLYVAAGRCDAKGIFKALAETAQGMVMGIAMGVQQRTGVNLLTDVVEHMGPEAALIVALNGGLIPDAGIVLESGDPAKLQNALLRMLASAQWQKGTGVERTRIGGVDVHVVKLMPPDLGGPPIAPTFGVVDGHLLVTLFPISFQRFLATKRGERPSIEANPDYAALRARVPDDALSLSYLDVRRGVAIAYDTVMPILQAMPQQEGGMPVYEFPEASIFTKHLYGRIAWRVADDRGMHWHSHSSTDVGAILFGLGAAGGSLFMFTAGDSVNGSVAAGNEAPPPQVAVLVTDKQVEVDECTANLRRFRNRLRALQRSNEPFPKSLEELRGRWIDARTLIVPGTDGKRYRYLGPEGKNGVLIVGAPNGPDGHVCVLVDNGGKLEIVRLSPRQVREKLGD